MRVISNTAISIDGRIGTKDLNHIRLGSPFDLIQMSNIRKLADAVLVGGNTFRNWSIPLFTDRHTCENPMLNVILTRTFNLPFSDDYLNEKRIKPIVFSCQKPKVFVHSVECICAEGENFLPFIVQNLKERGVKTLLIEAGGDLIFQFLKLGLLNEMHLTLCPKLIGGIGAPSLLGGEGFRVEQIKNTKLLSTKVIEDEIYLHYAVLNE
jgi:riboflavin-specific deaminase-like protein